MADHDQHLLCWRDDNAENGMECELYPGFDSMMEAFGVLTSRSTCGGRVREINAYRISGPNLYQMDDPWAAYDAWRAGLDETNPSAFDYDARDHEIQASAAEKAA